MRGAAGWYPPPPARILNNVEEIEQDNYGNGNAESPKKNAAHVQLRAFNDWKIVAIRGGTMASAITSVWAQSLTRTPAKNDGPGV